MTDEPPSLVDAWYEKVKPTYPIVCLKNGKLEDFLGVEFFPTGAVIRPDGTLAYAGSVSGINGPLKSALKDAKKGSLFPAAFKKAAKLMRAGDLKKSYAVLLDLMEKGKLGADEAYGAQFRDYLEGLAKSALEQANGLVRGGEIYRALERIHAFAGADPEFPASPEIEALLTRLRELPKYKKELAGGEKFVEAEAIAAGYEFTDAFKAYRSIWKKFEGTQIAELAHQRATEILENGRAGWNRACEVCRRSRTMTACEKHAERVKL